MAGRRHFGTVRKRSSGRWQGVYFHEGRYHSAGIFLTEPRTPWRAWRQLRWTFGVVPGSIQESGDVTLRIYGNEWLNNRPDLAVRTRELYRFVLDKHIYPNFGDMKLSELAPSKIRGWHAKIAGDHPATAAKAYRLLSSIMRTAVDDGLLLTSPSKVKGAATERAAERPIATVSEIDNLTLAMPDHLKVVIPLAAWCQLRQR